MFSKFSQATMHRLVEQQVERTPQKPAFLLVNGREISFAHYNRRANRLVHYLIQQGLQKGDVVGVCLPRSPGMYIAVLAILKAGGVFLMIPPTFPNERKQYIGTETNMRLLITNTPSTDIATETLVLDKAFWQSQSAYSSDNPGLVIAPDDPASIVYTSGSTGEPKGVIRSHRSVTHMGEWMTQELPFEANDRYATSVPITAVGFGRECFFPHASGIPLLLVPDQHRDDPRKFSNILKNFNATWLYGSPALMWMLVSVAEKRGVSFPALRVCIIAGDVVTTELIRKFRACAPLVTLVNCYGTSEAPIGTRYVMPPELDVGSTPTIPTGSPPISSPIHLLDEHLQPVPSGEIGEIYIGGDTVAIGYWNDPDLTAERFPPDPFANIPEARLYRTGDLARIGDDGNFILIGRSDHQVNLRGYRVQLTEIEKALETHPKIENAVVVAKNRSIEGSPYYLVAYITVHEPVSVNTLKTFMTEQLPAYMLPAQYRQLEALPMLPNAKPDRVLLTKTDMGTTLAT